MRLVSSLLTLIAASVFVPSQASAQLTSIAFSGCFDGGQVGGAAVTSFGGQPTVGNLSFGLQHLCPGTSNAAFLVWGSCNPSPGSVSWDLSNSCFASWTSAPASCPNVIQTMYVLDGAPTQAGGLVSFAFPIPPIVELVTVTQANPFCFQLICVQVGGPAPCRSVSQGARMVIR